MTSQKNIRVIGDEGLGATIVGLRDSAAMPSKSAATLAKNFRALSLAVDGKAGVPDVVAELAAMLGGMGIAEAAVVADAATAAVAVALAVAHPDLTKSVALLSPENSVGDVSNLKAPVLALFGTGDTTRAPAAARTFCKAIPNCRLIYVYDAGRALDDERPEAVAAALEDFALRREGYLVNGRSGHLYP